ncbi:hypothetical protein RHMOL_Rhmol07G0039500 [Rhododendron molle]|uniref:Uncharacterized protein n=1 Tax=Rhododendron molle TaxID=49168 RepID=A0ACC0MYS8_RHOML|nr:hypothetical protein RHMOL_Rhmol07G0039500 [Rhododendron molle]
MGRLIPVEGLVIRNQGCKSPKDIPKQLLGQTENWKSRNMVVSRRRKRHSFARFLSAGCPSAPGFLSSEVMPLFSCSLVCSDLEYIIYHVWNNIYLSNTSYY